MNIDAIAPIIEQIVKDSLSEKVYLYGRYQRSLTNRVASGRLRNSIRAVVQDNKQGVQIISLTAFGQPLENTYAYWLINDRKPNTGKEFANIGAIEEWIRNKKSFRMRDFKTGKYIEKSDATIKSAAFAISRSIGKFGYQNKPKNFIEVSYEKIINNDQIRTLLEGQVYNDLLNAIEGL